MGPQRMWDRCDRPWVVRSAWAALTAGVSRHHTLVNYAMWLRRFAKGAHATRVCWVPSRLRGETGPG